MITRELQQTVEAAAREVGQRMREVSASDDAFQVQHKGITDLVTEIDLWAEQRIRERLDGALPDTGFLGEESGGALLKTQGVGSFRELCARGSWWVVDPLDGTSNFVNRIPHSAVSIGLLEQGRPRYGVIYDPYRDELFAAERGKGATLNGRPIRAATKTKLIDAVVGTGFPHDHQERWELYRFVHDAAIRNFRKVRVFGSAALEQCWVACGRLDGFLEYGLKPWDICAGSLIVEEAGGTVGSFVDEPNTDYTIFHESILVAGKELYPVLFKVVHEADLQGRRSLR